MLITAKTETLLITVELFSRHRRETVIGVGVMVMSKMVYSCPNLKEFGGNPALSITKNLASQPPQLTKTQHLSQERHTRPTCRPCVMPFSGVIIKSVRSPRSAKNGDSWRSARYIQPPIL